MKPSEKLVIIILANHADEKGYCWPSVKTLSRESCLSESSVKRAIKGLEWIGLIKVTRAHRVSNGYQLMFLGVKLTPRGHGEPSRGSKQRFEAFRVTPQPSVGIITQPVLLKIDVESEKERFKPLSAEAQKDLDALKASLREAPVEYQCSAISAL